MKEAMAAFMAVTALQFLATVRDQKLFLVEVLTEVCSLENIASWNWRKIVVAWSDSVLFAGLHVEDMPKRWVIFALFVYCMFRATRYKKKRRV